MDCLKSIHIRVEDRLEPKCQTPREDSPLKSPQPRVIGSVHPSLGVIYIIVGLHPSLGIVDFKVHYKIIMNLDF